MYQNKLLSAVVTFWRFKNETKENKAMCFAHHTAHIDNLLGINVHEKSTALKSYKYFYSKTEETKKPTEIIIINLLNTN